MENLHGEELVCPRCGGKEFTEHDCGPDGYDDDIFYLSWSCDACGLWFDGWDDKWYIDVDNWTETEDAKEYVPDKG